MPVDVNHQSNKPNQTNRKHRLMGLRGYRIGNVDVTLILQKPKVGG